MTELQILNAVKNNGGFIDYAKLINLGMTDSVWQPITDHQLIVKLIDSHILSGKAEAYGTITFGKDGHLRLRDLQQADDDIKNNIAQETASKKKERLSDFFHDLLVAVITLFVTYLIDCVKTFFFGA